MAIRFAGPRRFLSVALTATLALWGSAREGRAGTWASHGPEGGSFRALVIDPVNPEILYAGIEGGPLLLKSTDGGARWAPSGEGLVATPQGAFVGALAFDPTNPSILYAGTGNDFGPGPGFVPGQVFRSSDAGAHWSPLSSNFDSFSVRALAIDPRQPDTLYAGTDSYPYSVNPDPLKRGGVWRSTDGGHTWRRLLSGNYYRMLIHPRDPDTVVAAGHVSSRSTDGGETWSPFPASGFSTPMFDAAFDPETPARIYLAASSSLWRSYNGGLTWVQSPVQCYSVAVDPRQPSTVYAGSYWGIYKSEDYGNTWTMSGGGSQPGAVLGLSVAGSGTPSLYAVSARAGIYKSTDGGGTWDGANGGVLYSSVVSLSIDPGDPRTLYAGTSNAGLFRSRDGGSSWRPINRHLLGVAGVSVFAIDPREPATVYASGGPLERSRDRGDTWTQLAGPPGNTWSLAFDPSSPAILYAGTSEGLFRSADDAATWQPLPFRHPDGYGGVDKVWTDAARPKYLYLRSGLDSFRSIDAGLTWQRLAPRNLYMLAVDPRSPATLYAYQPGEGLLKSRDGGTSWTSLTPPVPGYDGIGDFTFHPAAAGVLYVSIPDHGVFESLDDGASWKSLGGPHPVVPALVVAPSHPAVLHAATVGGGVFSLTLDELPPPGEPLILAQVPGFRFKVRFTSGTQVRLGRQEGCVPDTLCVSDALPGRTEVFLRLLGPRPNGFRWVEIARLSTARIEIWIEEIRTGARRYYQLESAAPGPPGTSPLPGLIDRTAFLP